MGLNAGDFVKLFKNLLPPGLATKAEKGTVFDGFAQACADELVRIDGRTADLQNEIDPRTTFELLPEWEDALGLPDPCVTGEQTVDQRRNAVVVKLTQLGGNNPDFYISVAAQLGYAITITEFKPARCGVSHCGDRLNGATWAYAWRVNSENNTIRVARVGSAVAGDLLRDWSNQQLECAIEARQPSHGILQFSYGHDGIKFDLSSTAGGGKVTVRTPGQQAGTGTLQTLFNFTRGSVGAYLDSDGVLKSAAIDTPRVEYDATGALLGLLLESARTNIALQSEQFGAPWGGTGIATVNTNVANAPDGTATADNFVESAGGTFHFMSQTIAIANATVYTGSVFLKAKERSFANVQLGGVGFPNAFANIDLTTGVVTTGGGGVGGSIKYPNGWWRVWVSVLSTGVSGDLLVSVRNNAGAVNYAGDGASGIYAWGAQLELGARPSSYIKTAGASVARLADRVFRTLGGEFNQASGSYFIQYTMRAADNGGNQFLLDANAAGVTSQNATLFHANGGTVRMSLNSNGGFGGLAFTAVAPGELVEIKAAGAFALNDVAVGRDGAMGTADVVAPIPTAPLTRLDVGTSYDGTQSCTAVWIKKFDTFPTRKSDADLLALMAA